MHVIYGNQFFQNGTFEPLLSNYQQPILIALLYNRASYGSQVQSSELCTLHKVKPSKLGDYFFMRSLCYTDSLLTLHQLKKTLTLFLNWIACCKQEDRPDKKKDSIKALQKETKKLNFDLGDHYVFQKYYKGQPIGIKVF